MTDRRCSRCRHYRPEDKMYWGECRRFPPVLWDNESTGYECFTWPRVEPEEWCGEFSLDGVDIDKVHGVD